MENMTYQARIEALPGKTELECENCDWHGSLDQALEVRDAVLTPGDPSPGGRCPQCEQLAYPKVEPRTLLNALRLMGYAVVAFSPDELAGVDAKGVQNRLVELGNEVISDLTETPADEDKPHERCGTYNIYEREDGIVLELFGIGGDLIEKCQFSDEPSAVQHAEGKGFKPIE